MFKKKKNQINKSFAHNRFDMYRVKQDVSNNNDTLKPSEDVSPTASAHYLGKLEMDNEEFFNNPNHSSNITYQRPLPNNSLVNSKPANVANQPKPFPDVHLYTNNPVSIHEANALLPKQVAREIIAEKLRSLMILLVGLLGLLTASFFIILHFQIGSQDSIIGINKDVIPNFILMIGCGILCLSFFAWGILNMRQIVHESKNYLEHRRQGYDILPQFILTNFKRMVKRVVIWNWICFPSYVFLSIIMGILIFLNTYKGQSFNFAFWSLGEVPSLDPAIITVAIVFGALLFLHLFNAILVKKRKVNIIGYFGSQVMNNEQVRDISKRTNRICFAFFVLIIVIIFFAITIPLIILRRKRGGEGIKWPWKII